MHKDAVLEMEPDGTRQHQPLQVAPFADQIVQRILVGDPDDVLLDDGTFIQCFRHVVARGPDDLNPLS